ncbi:MAG: superoxide dismutase, Ni [Phycisphaerae bacterium]|nr:superoxide dismutase, Ni [Phycisphaerae bacterium]
MRFINRKNVLLVSIMTLAAAAPLVYSHCQIPCGIYDDPARLKMIDEHISTIEKSIVSINQLSEKSKPDYNQIVRWVDNKEIHADAASDIITYYFLAQRIKPVDKNDRKEYDKYVRELILLHKLMIQCMKTKQSADPATTAEMRTLLAEFKKEYLTNHKES